MLRQFRNDALLDLTRLEQTPARRRRYQKEGMSCDRKSG
jgi:hypothetical protein